MDDSGPARPSLSEAELPDRPRLRPLELIPMEREGETVYCLRDPSGDSEAMLMLSQAALAVLGLMDGSRDWGDIQADLYRGSGSMISREVVRQLVERLEESLFLDSPHFEECLRAERETFARSERRPAAFAGTSYEENPEVLGPWLDSLLPPMAPPAAPKLRALIAPHIDPTRGAPVYGSAYGRARAAECERIIILGISHKGGEAPYSVLGKDFATPFGDCPVDRDLVAELARGLPFDPLAEPWIHRREHSIEFQALFLRRVLRGWERIRIVPILCCFPYLSEDSGHTLPYPDSWRQAFVERLGRLLDEKTLIVLGVDFAHVGRRFGDSRGADDSLCRSMEEADRSMMEAIATGGAAAFRETIDAEKDARRVCGYPAILTLLEAAPGLRGAVLDYGQAREEATGSLVTFGAMAFT